MPSIRGEATITLGGKERTLRFGRAEIADLEEALGGRSITRLLSDGVGVSFVRAAIVIGIRHQTLATTKLVCKWLDESVDAYEAASRGVVKAIGFALRGPAFANAAAKLDGVTAEEDDGEDEQPVPEKEDEDDGPNPPKPTAETMPGISSTPAS